MHILFVNFCAEDYEPTGNDESMFMYYVNDGVYGSFNCILFDHATVEPTLPEVDWCLLCS